MLWRLLLWKEGKQIKIVLKSYTLLYKYLRHSYFDVVVGLAWSRDPESYAGGSIVAGRASHAIQVTGVVPD